MATGGTSVKKVAKKLLSALKHRAKRKPNNKDITRKINVKFKNR